LFGAMKNGVDESVVVGCAAEIVIVFAMLCDG
jgi:hypothetical protein